MTHLFYENGDTPKIGDRVECIDPGDSKALTQHPVYTIALMDDDLVYLDELGIRNGYFPRRFRLLSRAIEQ